MRLFNRNQQKTAQFGSISLAILSLLLLNTPVVVLAGPGHDHSGASSFQGASGNTNTPIEVDAQTAQRLGIKVEPVRRQPLAVGIKTTGQIETLPSQRVEVNTPITGAKVVELLVEPGAVVQKGQPLAVVTSPDLLQLRVTSEEKRAEAIGSLQQAQTDLRLAQQNYQRYLQISNANIAQAQSQVAFNQEKYNKDIQLASAGALPRRNALESQTQLAEARAKLTEATSRRDIIETEAQVKRAQATVQVAQERLRLSESTYNARLQQIGSRPNSKGLVTITAPISGKIADREVTINQTFNDAGGKLMTIVNDSRVFATANIYEKDLGEIKVGQRVNLKVASIPNRIFSGRVARIGTLVQGETQVVPVQAEIENLGGQLKPGMFASLEVLTDKTSAPVLTIPASSVVDANGKKIIYVQNGNAFESVDVTLGETSGDIVEVKTGLFEGDLIVTQRAPQLYAQSLRGGSTKEDSHDNSEEGHDHSEETQAKTNNFSSIPLWLLGLGGVGVMGGAFAAGSFWSNRRLRSRFARVGNSEYDLATYETNAYIDNHKQPTLSAPGKILEDSGKE
jgi:membrane fusion protein, heavy metal efflux system